MARPNEEEKERAELRRKNLQREDKDDFVWLMNNRQGRRFIWRLLDAAGIFRSSFTGSSETFFREGQRDIGLRIMSRIHDYCPDQYALMLKESNERPSDNPDD